MRKTLEFLIPLEWDLAAEGETPTPRAWLDADIRRTTVRSEACRLRFHLWATGAEEIRINAAMDEVSGGIGATVDLERGLSNTRAGIMAALEASLWPEGRPEVTTDEDRQAQSDAMDAAYVQLADADPTDIDATLVLRKRDAFERMHEIRGRQEVYAAWPTLIVDPPAGWEDLGQMDMPPRYLAAIQGAYRRARAEAEEAAGK